MVEFWTMLEIDKWLHSLQVEIYLEDVYGTENGVLVFNEEYQEEN